MGGDEKPVFMVGLLVSIGIEPVMNVDFKSLQFNCLTIFIFGVFIREDLFWGSKINLPYATKTVYREQYLVLWG
jgi:hypothetical protein